MRARLTRSLAAGFLLAMLWLCSGAAMAQEEYIPARKSQPESTIAPIGNVPRACTQMWCQEGYNLQTTSASWPHGYYSFKVIADDRVYLCEGNLPLPPCGMPAMTCNDKAITIGESGCAMGADSHGFHMVHLKDVPENISVSISGPSGTVIHEGKVTKQCGYPNGAQCDPRQCCSAIDYMTINW